MKTKYLTVENIKKPLKFLKDWRVHAKFTKNKDWVLELILKQETHDGVHDEINNTELRILLACQKAKSTPELLEELGYKSRTRNYRSALSKLIDTGLLVMTQPDKPRSKSQKYIISEIGIKHIQQNKGLQI